MSSTLAEEGLKSGPASARGAAASPASTHEAVYQNQIQSIQQIFAAFDHEGSGNVKLERVPELVVALGRDQSIGTEVHRLLVENIGNDAPPGSVASFEDIVQKLKKVEESKAIAHQEQMTTPLTLLKRLNAYRKHCESNGEYIEAQKARRKYEELRSKEEDRQRKLVEQAQEHELNEVEQAQRQQFLSFSAAWDKYMADYESAAYMSLERLKEQHAQEFAKLQSGLQQQASAKPFKFSRELLELRRKQEALAKLGKYEDAYKVKESADRLEEWELARGASQVSESARRQEQRLRQQQHKALSALLKRIQRDRGEQIRHRQMDSQRLIQRNKNLKVDLCKKQHLEFCRAEAAIKSIMSQPEYAQKLLDTNDPAQVARCAATGELPSLGKIKWKGPALPENYEPPGGILGGKIRNRESSGRTPLSMSQGQDQQSDVDSGSPPQQLGPQPATY